MHHYLIVLRAQKRHALARAFQTLLKAVMREGALKADSRRRLVAALEVLAHEAVLPVRARHWPALRSALQAVSSETAANEGLRALGSRLCRGIERRLA